MTIDLSSGLAISKNAYISHFDDIWNVRLYNSLRNMIFIWKTMSYWRKSNNDKGKANEKVSKKVAN